MIHDLKIQKMYYDRLVTGEKKFEVRLNDRDYQVNDTIVFNVIGTTVRLLANISYIHSGLGMAEGYVILGIEAQI